MQNSAKDCAEKCRLNYSVHQFDLICGASLESWQPDKVRETWVGAEHL
jgi:hypothetical protein